MYNVPLLQIHARKIIEMGKKNEDDQKRRKEENKKQIKKI